MQFLIDGHSTRVAFRRLQWKEGVAGQLLTPLTRYRLGELVYGVDNGAFTSLKIKGLTNLLRRNLAFRAGALFVAVPDKVGCHRTTLKLYEDYKHIAEGWPKAFVAQDGFDGAPECDAIFIGGTNAFKDSAEALDVVAHFLSIGKHVHVGRVNAPSRFMRFHNAGAHTCDGSGVSRYDHMIALIKLEVERASRT